MRRPSLWSAGPNSLTRAALGLGPDALSPLLLLPGRVGTRSDAPKGQDASASAGEQLRWAPTPGLQGGRGPPPLVALASRKPQKLLESGSIPTMTDTSRSNDNTNVKVLSHRNTEPKACRQIQRPSQLTHSPAPRIHVQATRLQALHIICLCTLEPKTPST